MIKMKHLSLLFLLLLWGQANSCDIAVDTVAPEENHIDIKEPTIVLIETRILESHQFVLQQNKTNKHFYFDFSEKDKVFKLDILYLGSIKMKNGNIIKFLLEDRTFGFFISPHGRQDIFLYNKENKLLGSFDYTDANKLEIIHNKLIFYANCEENSNQLIKTEIDFFDSIPSMIFIPCQANGMGDIYNFQKYGE